MPEFHMTSLAKEERDLNDLIQEAVDNRFDPTEPLPDRPDYSILIDGSGLVEAGGGSLIAVNGLPKTRKSTLLALIASSILSEDKKQGIIETPRLDGSILWFDTESGRSEMARMHNHIIDMSGRSGEEHIDYVKSHYFAMSMRSYAHEERLAMIDRMIMSTDLGEGVACVFLDGVADLVSSVNEISESKEVVDRLMMWCDKLKCPLFVAIHLADTTKRSIGHLGAFIRKKMSYAIITSNEYDGSPSLVKAGMTRNGKRFKPFLISNIEEDMPNEGRPIFYDEDAEAVKDSYKPSFTKSTETFDELPI